MFRDRIELDSELALHEVQHWAPNCCTFSRAREYPIPGVTNPPKPLRSESFPEGIPDVVQDLPVAKRRKLSLDTDMANLAADRCLEAHRNGRYFSLENPMNSLARHLTTWRRLEREPGVLTTFYHACMFSPCKRRKAQILIHNIPGLVERVGLTCENSRLCSRTGERHLPWRPTVVNGRVSSFATADEREYPQAFCEAFAKGLTFAEGTSPSSFIEIFSGPNAPLTRAVALEWNIDPPLRVESQGRPGVEHSETQTLTNPVIFTPNATGVEQEQRTGTSEPPADSTLAAEPQRRYRIHAVEAGSQPSFGKRTQLIADGLCDPAEHLRLAKGLDHPFDSLKSLKPEHASAIAEFVDVQSLISRRMDALHMIKTWANDLREEQSQVNRSASWTAKKLGTKVNTLLMERLQDLLGVEDKQVPGLCLKGLKITGRAHESPFFEQLEVRPIMSWDEFITGCNERSERMIDRVRYMAEKGSKELACAIWEKTQKEVKAGTMGPAMTLQQARSMYPGPLQVTPSFGLEQGQDTGGQKKYRRIDDHTASGVNQAAHRLQKVPMVMVDYVGVLCRALAGSVERISMATEDMKGAYRQIPLSPEDVRFAITAVYNPEQREVSLHEMYGQPFGAGHAVPNFCRVAEWIARVIQRLFSSTTDHFFDDFFVVEPSATIKSAVFCLRETFQILGFQLDPEKSQPPSEVCAILGVCFNTESLHSQKIIHVQAKESRLAFLQDTIDKVLSTGRLSPALAGSLVGKFQFLCSTLFGRVGRCCTGPLRRRQYASYPVETLTAELTLALRQMKCFLSTSPSRELKVHHINPILLYTDASDVPERVPQRILGAFLHDPIDGYSGYTAWPVPETLVEKWLQRKSFMGQLELLAAPVAFETWRTRLQNRSVFLFCDNDSASANLVRGYSPQVDSTSIVGDFWLTVARLKASVYIERVESKSNLADGPSRFNFFRGPRFGSNLDTSRSRRVGTNPHTPASQSGALEQRGG